MSQIIILLSFLLVVLLLPLQGLLNLYFLYLSVILLPLRSASLMHKNRQRRNDNNNNNNNNNNIHEIRP